MAAASESQGSLGTGRGSKARLLKPTAAAAPVVTVKPATKYFGAGYISALHVVSALIDLLFACLLISLVMSGYFALQLELDGFFCVALIAIWHLLFNILLLVAVARDWEAGYTVYVSTGLPWLAASAAVLIYMIVDEAGHCKGETKSLRTEARCFLPPITLLCLMLMQGVLWFVFSRRWKSVKKTRAAVPTTKHTTQHKGAATMKGTEVQGLQVGTVEGTLTNSLYSAKAPVALAPLVVPPAPATASSSSSSAAASNSLPDPTTAAAVPSAAAVPGRRSSVPPPVPKRKHGRKGKAK